MSCTRSCLLDILLHLKGKLIATEYRREDHECMRDRAKMVCTIFRRNDSADPISKITLSTVPRILLFFVLSTRSPEKLFESLEVKCHYWAYKKKISPRKIHEDILTNSILISMILQRSSVSSGYNETKIKKQLN